MGAVNISGYTFSTCSTYESPALRIADTHSTVTIQLTTRPRPDDLYTQKVFTISNSDYSYLRPMVTSDSLVRYEGYVSSQSTSGYSGSTSVTSTTATSALVSASLQASVTYSASKTYNSSKSSTSGYTGVSSSSSQTNTTIETIFNTTSSATDTAPVNYTNVAGAIGTYTSLQNTYTNPYGKTYVTWKTTNSASTKITIPYNSLSNGRSITLAQYNTMSWLAGTYNNGRSFKMLITDRRLSKKSTMFLYVSGYYPLSISITGTNTSASMLEPSGNTAGSFSLWRASDKMTLSYIRNTTGNFTGSVMVAEQISTNINSKRFVNINANSDIEFIYSNSTRTSINNRGLGFGWGFGLNNFISFPLVVFNMCNYENETAYGFNGWDYTFNASNLSFVSSRNRYSGNTQTRYTNVKRNTTVLDFWDSSITTKSTSTTTLSSSTAVANLSSTTALTRSSSSGVTFTNSASGSTSLSKTYELASSYYSNNNSSDYNVSTVTTALTSVSTVNAMTSFPSGASSTAKTVKTSAYNNNFYRNTNFKYYTNTNYSASSVTNDNGAYTNGNMSSTTALTQASYYSTTSSTIGSMSSTTSIGSTIRV